MTDSATDNRTNELREKLDERGVEWKAGLDGVTFIGDWCFVEYENGKLAATCEPVLTPEQAIAATLGGEREKQLEKLVQDVWRAYSAKAESSFHPAWEVDSELENRIKTLGIEVSDDDR